MVDNIQNLTCFTFQSSLEVDDFTKPAVDCFVEAMYTGEIETLEKGIFEDVNKMAHVFEVNWLTKRCVKFFETDVLNFEEESYEEILFACEIASRSHYNLKQSKLMSCFVRNVAFTSISKPIFIQRYLGRIDTALVICRKDLNIISSCLISYISLTLDCEELDENSRYLLQKLDIKKFSHNYPTQFNELTYILTDVSKRSESRELKEVLDRFVKVGDEGVGSGSEDLLEDISSTEDSGDSDLEELVEGYKDEAIQTDDVNTQAGKFE